MEERRKENREDSNEERDGAWKEDGGKMFCGNGRRIWGGRMGDGWRIAQRCCLASNEGMMENGRRMRSEDSVKPEIEAGGGNTEDGKKVDGVIM